MELWVRRNYGTTVLKEINRMIGRDPAYSLVLAKEINDLLVDLSGHGIFMIPTSKIEKGMIRTTMEYYAHNSERYPSDKIAQELHSKGKSISGNTKTGPFLPYGLLASFFKLSAVHPPYFTYDYEIPKSAKKNMLLTDKIISTVEVLVEPYLSMNGLLNAH